MNPKEKARELVERFEKIELVNHWQDSIITEDAKQCALICVEEIMDASLRLYSDELASSQYYDKDTEYTEYLHEYWQQVKEEIRKLA